ncbi:hypothetical protein BH686_19070 [Rhodococcus erythropolis]|nr:hypothetical protein BH686_19070 [Rhodococcus erythropolis]
MTVRSHNTPRDRIARTDAGAPTNRCSHRIRRIPRHWAARSDRSPLEVRRSWSTLSLTEVGHFIVRFAYRPCKGD